MKKVILVVIGLLCLLMTGRVQAQCTFSDVPETHPFYDEITGICELGITEGYADGTYRPANYITRAAMAAFIQRTIDNVIIAPHTEYLALGGEAFVPGGNVDYSNTYGMGGAYIVSGQGALVAPVHLPHGAVVTAFKVFFNDNSAEDMSVYLSRLSLTQGGYADLAYVDSSGIVGFGNKTDSAISNTSIDNTLYGYHIYAYSVSWSSGLKIMGAVITYTVNGTE